MLIRGGSVLAGNGQVLKGRASSTIVLRMNPKLAWWLISDSLPKSLQFTFGCSPKRVGGPQVLVFSISQTNPFGREKKKKKKKNDSNFLPHSFCEVPSF